MLRVYYETDEHGELHYFIGPHDEPELPGQEITREEAATIAAIEAAQALHILTGQPTRGGRT